MRFEPVIIIGAGPAGLATALQLLRYDITARLFERSHPGGLLWNANWVENYPGFPTGISGPDLVQMFVDQAVSSGVTITPTKVTGLSWSDGFFKVDTPKETLLAKIAVIASGTKPKTLIDFSVPDDLRRRIYYEIVPLLHVKGKKIVIIGAGDAAFDYALNLARQNSVIILNRSGQATCLPLLWERVKAPQNITYCPQTIVIRLHALKQGGMNVECSSPEGLTTLQADYLIGAIGREPMLDFVSASLLEQSPELEKRGILHFVGDVKNDIFRQTAIAVGDGVRAAMCIDQALKESSNESDCLDRKRRHRSRLHR